MINCDVMLDQQCSSIDPSLMVVKKLFSHTSLEQHLFLSKKVLNDVDNQLNPIIDTEILVDEFKEEADSHLEYLKESLKSDTEKADTLLGQKRKRLSENLIADKKFDIADKKRWLEFLHTDFKALKNKYVYRKLNNWKSRIRSKSVKGKGKYRMNRVAEEAIFQVIAEHAKAHHRRHVELETGYVDEQMQRLQAQT